LLDTILELFQISFENLWSCLSSTLHPTMGFWVFIEIQLLHESLVQSPVFQTYRLITQNSLGVKVTLWLRAHLFYTTEVSPTEKNQTPNSYSLVIFKQNPNTWKIPHIYFVWKISHIFIFLCNLALGTHSFSNHIYLTKNIEVKIACQSFPAEKDSGNRKIPIKRKHLCDIDQHQIMFVVLASHKSLKMKTQKKLSRFIFEPMNCIHY